MRILIVDDDEHVRSYATRVLERAGHSVQAFGDGKGVAVGVQAIQPDLVLTDIFMPDVDGYELLRVIRAERPDLPVVVMSGGGYSMRGDFLRIARMLRATAILPKPFTASALLDTIRQAAALGPGPP